MYLKENLLRRVARLVIRADDTKNYVIHVSLIFVENVIECALIPLQISNDHPDVRVNARSDIQLFH